MLNCEQNEALSWIKAGHNVFIGGQAGTGKTHLLKTVATVLREKGKNVSITCTTGIACTHYPTSLGAMTIHRWSGMGDGRFSSQEICSHIKNRQEYKDALFRVINTDVLIIDEVSMLSKKLFEQLEEICALKDASRVFGGTQVILCGDFYQLPPVRNLLYDDDGGFCFSSHLFKTAFPHIISLTDVRRQRNPKLISIINDLSGKNKEMSAETIETLSKLPSQGGARGEGTVKLFATNLLVDSHNRDAILKAGGDLIEYKSEDFGDSKYMSRITAPRTLWVKKDCPVILIRNISDKLVNGSLGRVMTCESDCITVFFPKPEVTERIPKLTFSVYSPRNRSTLAERIQFPLKLAFALTIHKCQGMSLERLTVDCRNISQPGQLGVAVGRVQTLTGLRILNFNTKAYIQQPVEIEQFYREPSLAPCADLSCCGQQRLQTGQDCDTYDFPTSDITETTECDALLNEVEVDVAIADLQPGDKNIQIPADFDVSGTLESLESTQILTPLQSKINEVVKYLMKKETARTLETFICQQFEEIGHFGTDLNMDEASVVKQKDLNAFYKKCQQHQTSPKYKASCMLLFLDDPVVGSRQAQYHVCFEIFVELRKVFLKKKEELFPISEANVSERQLVDTATGAAKGKVRYIGGYCIAKLNYKYTQMQRANCFSSTENAQLSYHEARSKISILDNMKESEHVLKEETRYGDTLSETERKQNISHSLTNITDELFEFCEELCSMCLTFLNGKYVNIHGENIFDFCTSQLLASDTLYNKWIAVSCFMQTDDIYDPGSIDDLLKSMVDVAVFTNDLFSEVTRKFLSVMLNQFRKDFLQSFAVGKKMAHRHQIQVSKKSKHVALSFKSVTDDTSTGKIVSHHLLKAQILTDKGILSKFKKKELQLLCKSYEVSYLEKENKSHLVDKLSTCIASCDIMVNCGVLNQPMQEANVQMTTLREAASSQVDESRNVESSPQPGTSTSDPIPSTSGSSQNTGSGQLLERDQTAEHATDDDVRATRNVEAMATDESGDDCSHCGISYLDGEDWVQCNHCNGWYHRKCAGLTNAKRWKNFSKPGVEFTCSQCQ